MVKFPKKLDEFRKKLSEDPPKAFIIVLFTLVFIYIIYSLRNYLLSLISPYLIYLFLNFLIIMSLYALYSFYIIPFVFQLPDGKQSFSEFLEKLKLKMNGLSLKIIFLGLLIGIMVLIGLFLIDIILGDLFTFTLDFNRILGFPNSINLGFFNFINHIGPALWEEIIFRGIMLTILLKAYSTRIAIFIDALLFGIFHLANLSPSIFDALGQLIYTFCYGIILSYLYVKTSNLIPCIIAHYVNNIISVLIITSEMTLTVYFSYILLISFFTIILRMGIIKLYEKYSPFLRRGISNKNSSSISLSSSP